MLNYPEAGRFKMWWMWLGIAFAAAYPLHRLGLWMESKDWVYYRRRPKSGAGSGFLEVAAIVDPAARHMLEARKEMVAKEHDGDDDDDRPPEDRVGDVNRSS